MPIKSNAFHPGQLVRLVRSHMLAVIIAPCKTPDHHWAVFIRANRSQSTAIQYISEQLLAPYVRHCWNKECHTPLNSSEHHTCPVCFWVLCPACGACKQGGCTPFGLTLQVEKPKPSPVLTNSDKDKDNKVDYDEINAGFSRQFWESIENMMEK